MPIYDLGYRRWEGKRSPDWLRFVTIAKTGFQLAFKSRWLRRMLFFAWLPAAYMAAAFFMYEQYVINNPQMMLIAEGMLKSMMGDSFQLLEDAHDLNPMAGRHLVWSMLMFNFFRYPQGALMVLLVGLIAPPLISRDVRSRAFLIYFSRPITRIEYILGKATTVWAYLALITTLPALTLYIIAVMLSPDFSVVLATWDIPLRILLASVVLMLPTTFLALAFSSLAWESRTAGFMWFAIWGLGMVAYQIVWVPLMATQNLASGTIDSRWNLISIYHSLGAVQQHVFGVGVKGSHVVFESILLSAITLVSAVVVYYRVSAPMRA